MRLPLTTAIMLLTGSLTAQVPCTVNDSQFTSREGGCQDLASNMVWTTTFVGTTSWPNAGNWCNNLVEGGFTDWRLPTLAELQAVDASGAATHLANLTVNGQYYWSSSTQGNKARAYAFGTNANALFPKSSLFFVLCTRPGLPALASPLAGSAPTARMSAVRFVADGMLTTTLSSPDQARRQCFFVASFDTGALPSVLTNVPGVVDVGDGRLDATGNASLRWNLGAAGVSSAAARTLWIGLVVLEPLGPVLYSAS